MKTWTEVKGNIKSLTDQENEELDFIADFIGRIVKRRLELGLSQRDLAEMTGIKQSAIARLESFKVAPQIDTLYKLLRPLKLKLILQQKQK
jgi:predicted transcriptional regulator